MVKRKKDVSIEQGKRIITFTPKKGWLEHIAQDRSLHFNMETESGTIISRLLSLVSSYSVDLENNKLEVYLKKGVDFPQKTYSTLAFFWKIEGLSEEFEFRRTGYKE